jgi:FMN phosphatase YigB (HAD superfamily)
MDRFLAFLDVDNTLLDFTSYVIPFYESYYNKKISPDYIPSAWDFSCLSETDKHHPNPNDLVPKNWPELLAPYPGAVDYTHALKATGVRVILVTRLNQKKQLFRLHNLINNSFVFDEIYFVSYDQPKGAIIDTAIKRFKPKKWMYCDDKGEECVDTLMRFGSNQNYRIFSFNHNYNKEAKIKHNSTYAFDNLVWCENEKDLYQKSLLYMADEIYAKDPNPQSW